MACPCLGFREALVECPSLDFQAGIFTDRTISNSLLDAKHTNVGGQIGEPLRKVILCVFVNLLDRLAFADESKQVDGENFLVGEVPAEVVSLR